MALFSKGSYEVLADMMVQEKREQIRDFNGLGAAAIDALAYRFADFFERDNRNFSRVKFLEKALSK